jgi:hypothetical protein
MQSFDSLQARVPCALFMSRNTNTHIKAMICNVCCNSLQARATSAEERALTIQETRVKETADSQESMKVCVCMPSSLGI